MRTRERQDIFFSRPERHARDWVVWYENLSPLERNDFMRRLLHASYDEVKEDAELRNFFFFHSEDVASDVPPGAERLAELHGILTHLRGSTDPELAEKRRKAVAFLLAEYQRFLRDILRGARGGTGDQTQETLARGQSQENAPQPPLDEGMPPLLATALGEPLSAPPGLPDPLAPEGWQEVEPPAPRASAPALPGGARPMPAPPLAEAPPDAWRNAVEVSIGVAAALLLGFSGVALLKGLRRRD